MVIQIVKKTSKSLVVNWAEEGTGLGVLTIEYDERGRYILDAEYIGIDKILKIIDVVNKKLNKDD